MATSARVAIRLKEESLGHPLAVHFDGEFTKYIYLDNYNPYLQIYVHYDGYPENGLGEELLKCSNYDEILRVITLGDSKQIYYDRGLQSDAFVMEDGDLTLWSTRYAPEQVGKPFRGECDYLYVFENDSWYIQSYDIFESTLLYDMIYSD